MRPESDARRVAVIIEDESDIRELLETLFTQAGFYTIPTRNGLEGINAVRAYNPDVTTLDVSMPGIDGFETVKRIRSFSSTYIVMITAHDEEIDTVQGLEAGADDYLTKPFRLRELRARIEAMLRRPRLARTQVSDAPQAAWPADAAVNTATLASAAAPVLQTPATAPVSQTPATAPVLQTPVAAPLLHASVTAPVLQSPVTVPPSTSGFGAYPTAAPGSAPAPFPFTPLALQGDMLGSFGAGMAADASTASVDENVTSAIGNRREYNGLVVHTDSRLVVRDGALIDLTGVEFDLLVAILDSKRRVRSLADLALSLRGESYVTAYYVTDADKHAVEVHMGNLRRKLGDTGANPRWIEAVPGVGYRLAGPQIS